MYKRVLFWSFLIMLCLGQNKSPAQILADSNGIEPIPLKDTVVLPEKTIAQHSDTTKIKEFNPKTATIRSAIIPGWGQAYNKKYWKIPIVYGALGVSAGFFFSNVKTYNELRQAVIYRQDGDPATDTLIGLDLRPLSTQALIQYRGIFRQYVDYSVLAFLLLWGLNVVDATVDAHLKGFNVSSDLTLKIRPKYRFDNNRTGIGLVFQLEKREYIFRLPR